MGAPWKRRFRTWKPSFLGAMLVSGRVSWFHKREKCYGFGCRSFQVKKHLLSWAIQERPMPTNTIHNPNDIFGLKGQVMNDLQLNRS